MFPRFRRLPVALAASLFLAVTVSRMFGYALLGYAWPPGSTILMHLKFGQPPITLSDGTGTWTGSAADALALWNAQSIPPVELMKITCRYRPTVMWPSHQTAVLSLLRVTP
jgi:hypothetical protein